MAAKVSITYISPFVGYLNDIVTIGRGLVKSHVEQAALELLFTLKRFMGRSCLPV